MGFASTLIFILFLTLG